MTEPVAGTPRLFVVAGPNGAGKTTFATEFPPSFVNCREFVNADLIAAGLSPFAPASQAMRARRLVLTRIRELGAAGTDFGFETTLSGRTYVPIPTGLRERGYRVHLFFLWMDLQRRSGRGEGRQPGPRGRTRRSRGCDSTPLRRRAEKFPRSVCRSGGRLVDLRCVPTASRPRVGVLRGRLDHPRPRRPRGGLLLPERGSMKENPRSLTQLANAAFRKAAEAVVRRARQTGTPILVWEDGRIRELSPDEAEAALPPAGSSPAVIDAPAANHSRRTEKND